MKLHVDESKELEQGRGENLRNWPAQSGWELPWLIFLSTVALGLGGLLVKATSDALCLPKEQIIVCGREWLSVLGPWFAVLIAVFALVPVQRQWEEMRRQNLLNYSSTLQVRMDNHEIFRRSIIEIILLYSELRDGLVSKGKNKRSPDFMNCLYEIHHHENLLNIVKEVRLRVIFLKLSSSKHSDISDFQVASSTSMVFSVAERIDPNNFNPFDTQRQLALVKEAFSVSTALDTWADAINLIDAAVAALRRFNDGIARDIGELESEMNRISSRARPDI
jgi:hypothetical protein